MEEQRCRVGEAIDAIENAAVAGQQAAAVLDADIPLQGGDGDIADKAADADDQSGHRIAMGHSIGVRAGASNSASKVVVVTPPRNPSRVLFGLTLGTTL